MLGEVQVGMGCVDARIVYDNREVPCPGYREASVCPGECRIGTDSIDAAEHSGLVVIVGKAIIRPYRANRRARSKRTNLTGSCRSANNPKPLTGYPFGNADDAKQIKIRSSQARAGVERYYDQTQACRVGQGWNGR